MVNFTAVESIFFAALEKPAGPERAAFLSQACGADVDLRRHVERMLAAHPQAGCFLNGAAQPLGTTTDEPPVSERPGMVIGPYKLLQEIGEGGMGVVYMAEQQEPIRRKVALKIIKPGLDSRQVIARFEAERQALALMDHQNIAKVLDAGATESGRPYFVMELVHGVPITTYCDHNHLTPKERLELFLPVCHAVQHAHQKGIIHRDLKPSNILVTMYDDKPVPKVIDFGVAKAVEQRLTEKTLFTQFGSLVGTFEYMSPEQAEMNAFGVDTRSDVYSLGVMLYELLTGSTPLERQRLREAAYGEIVRLIKEEEPPRPSTRLSNSGAALAGISQRRGIAPEKLASQVRGELDWIVMRCLEKDRTRRYETANGLARDVERYLHDEPVEACPPTVGYKLRKFARKNKAVLAALTAVVVAALLAVAGLTISTVLIARQRDEADSQRQLAERSSNEAVRQTAEAVRAKQDADRQRDAVSQNLYFADLRLGLEDWNAGNVARLSSKLLSHVPPTGAADRRGWEWYFLLSLCHLDERTLMNYTREASSVAWSPDGRYLASTGREGTVHVFDSTSWRLLRTWSGETVCGACWSPDSQRLAWSTTMPLSEVYVWGVESGEIKCLQGHTASVWKLAWSPDGKHLASAGMDKTIRIWEPALGTCTRLIEGGRGYHVALAWHPDGRMLASCGMGDEGLRIWDAVSGKELRSDPSIQEAGAAAWSPDGKHLALGMSTGECRLYRAADLSLTSHWQGHTSPVNAVAWHPDGSRLASAGADNLIQVWDPTNRSRVLSLRGHLNQVLSITWEPNGRRLASAGMDGLVKVWPVPPAPQPRLLVGHPGRVRALTWSDMGDTLRSLGAEDGVSALWNVTNGQCLAKVPVPRGLCGVFGSGGRSLAIATTDKKNRPAILIHEAGSGKLVQTVKPGTVFPTFDAFSPDASKLAVTDGRAVEIVDLRQNAVLFCWQGVQINGLSWSPEGRLLAIVGGGDKSDGGELRPSGWVHVLDIEKRQRTLKLRHGTDRKETTAVTWSPNGEQLVSGDFNGLAEVWDVSTGHKIASAHLHRAKIEALAWSPDGRRVASGSADGTVRIWDPSYGEEVLKLKVSRGDVTLLAWSPNGRRLATATGDGGIHVWDASAGYEHVHSQMFFFEQLHAYLNQASQRWDAGRKDEALALYEQTLQEDKAKLTAFRPWVGMSIRHRARIVISKGQNQEAIALYRLLVRLNKEDALTHGILSRLLESQGQWDEAIASYREAIRLNKDHADAAINLAWLLATCPDPNFRDAAQAIELARKAIELKPSAAHFRTILGVALYRTGDWKASATALEQSVRLQEGESVLNWLLLAMAHWQMDHKGEAHKWYDQAIEWMDKNPGSWAQPGDDTVQNTRRLGANHTLWATSQKEFQNAQLHRFRAEATDVLKEKSGSMDRK